MYKINKCRSKIMKIIEKYLTLDLGVRNVFITSTKLYDKILCFIN